MLGLHWPELIVVLVIALLVFGPKRLPDMGSAVGKTFQSFKRAMNEPDKPEVTPPANPTSQIPAHAETPTPSEVAK